MDFSLIIVLLLCVSVLVVFLTKVGSIGDKVKLAAGAILGAVGGTILMKLFKDRKGGELEQQKAEVKEAEEDFQKVVEEVLLDINKREDKDYNPILDERL